MKKLGFGFMRLPLLDGNDQTSFDKQQIFDMVDTYLEKGFNYFDTAYMYHDGASERMLKDALIERHPRDSYYVATKMPTMLLEKEEDVERIFAEQLERTGAGYFDYYLLHCLSTNLYEAAQKYDLFNFVQEKKAQGLIKRVGFSFHDKADVLDKILTEHPEMEFVQLQINYLDWEDDNVQSRLCYEVARKHGKDIIVMEPVKGGTLANLPPRAGSLLKAHNSEMSTASWAIRFAASCEGVFMVLSGMSNMQQLSDNTSYMEHFQPLDANEMSLCLEAADIIRASVSVPCTACRYCVEGCPMNIAIPEYFALYNGALSGEKPDAKAEYAELSAKYGKASECIECGQCESHCPQHIEIIKRLKDVAAEFES